MSYPEFLIDKRVIQRNIEKGIVDAKEHAKVLAKLPDVQTNAEVSALDSQSGESDED